MARSTFWGEIVGSFFISRPGLPVSAGRPHAPLSGVRMAGSSGSLTAHPSMDASDSTPPTGESVSEEAEQTTDSPTHLWRCTFCGNVLIRNARPTRCFHCRRGESERQLNDTRLFVEIAVEELVGS